jgi:hypothetical protein
MGTYIVMIYGDEEVWEAWNERESVANAAAHRAFNDTHGEAVIGGHELDRSWNGRSLRPDARGGRQVVDGSFLDGRTVLGGYYLIEAPDLDHAVRIAGDLPEASAPSSGVEVRPLAPS